MSLTLAQILPAEIWVGFIFRYFERKLLLDTVGMANRELRDLAKVSIHKFTFVDETRFESFNTFMNHFPSVHKVVFIRCNIPITLSIPTSVSSLKFNRSTFHVEVLPQDLKVLSLRNLFYLQPSIFAHLPKTLTTLDIPCTSITDESLKHLAKTLTALNISNCCEITASGLANLPRNLKSLSMAHCEAAATSAGIKHLPPALKKLVLAGCCGVDTNVLEHLPQNLEYLDLERCTVVDSDMKLLPASLKYLNLNGCNVSLAAIKSAPCKSNLERINVDYKCYTFAVFCNLFF